MVGWIALSSIDYHTHTNSWGIWILLFSWTTCSLQKLSSWKFIFYKSAHMISAVLCPLPICVLLCLLWNWTVVSEAKKIGLLECAKCYSVQGNLVTKKNFMQRQLRKRVALSATCLKPSLVFVVFIQKHGTITIGVRKFSSAKPVQEFK